MVADDLVHADGQVLRLLAVQEVGQRLRATPDDGAQLAAQVVDVVGAEFWRRPTTMGARPFGSPPRRA